MKPLIYFFLLLFAKQVFPQEIIENKTKDLAPIYQFTVKDVNGNDFDFGCLEDKKILIINTASKCMFRSNNMTFKSFIINTKIVIPLL